MIIEEYYIQLETKCVKYSQIAASRLGRFRRLLPENIKQGGTSRHV